MSSRDFRQWRLKTGRWGAAEFLGPARKVRTWERIRQFEAARDRLLPEYRGFPFMVSPHTACSGPWVVIRPATAAQTGQHWEVF